MDSILQSIEDWFSGLLVSGIMDHLTSTFDSVNDKVGEISTNVGMSPAGFSPAVYGMIENISENVIMPMPCLRRNNNMIYSFSKNYYKRFKT